MVSLSFVPASLARSKRINYTQRHSPRGLGLANHFEAPSSNAEVMPWRDKTKGFLTRSTGG